MSRASAPGKLVLVGEYAVLRGHPALVTAVSRRVVLTAVEPSDGAARGALEPPPPEVEATLAHARALGHVVPAQVALDVSALHHAGTKLGLGSSAAGAAAAARLVLGSAATTAEVAALADAGHRAVARAGSGIDVAASVYGGTLRCVRDGEGLRVEPVATPSGLVPRVVFTGASARTSTLVAAVEALETRDPAQAAALLTAIAAAAAAFDAALLARSTGEALAAVSAHAAAMAALGDAAGAPIVEARLARIGALAHASAGAAKPSGAGGGDVALAFFADEPSATRFDAACAGEGFVVVPVSLGAEGARLD